MLDAAFKFRDLLQQLRLETFPMVTGGKGMHVIAPLTPQAEWPQVRISPIGWLARPSAILLGDASRFPEY